jgi:hypothetical protein
VPASLGKYQFGGARGKYRFGDAREAPLHVVVKGAPRLFSFPIYNQFFGSGSVRLNKRRDQRYSVGVSQEQRHG